MFNWYTAPTFAVMLLFWLLACYILTRSPRSLLSLTAAAALIATAAYLLGQGMEANTTTVAQWRPWARNLLWGATLAPTLWYWVTLLLLREQGAPGPRRYLSRIGYPLGLVFAALTVFLTAAIYRGDSLFRWSAPSQVAANQVIYSHYHLRQGTLFPGFLALLLGTTLVAAINVGLGWRWSTPGPYRRRFVWLFLSGLLFLAAANTLGLASSVNLAGDRAIAVSHLALGAAMLAIAWNVAAYSLLIRGQVIRADVLYFLTSLGAACVLYTALFVILAAPDYSLQLLRLLVITLLLIVLATALMDTGRQVLDRLFFGEDVQRLRANLTIAVQEAALSPNVDTALSQAQKEIEAVSAERLVRLTEEALRRLHKPAALAQSELLDRIPRTLAAAADCAETDPTPLQRAQTLRTVLAEGIERLKPSDADPSVLSPGALQYQILRQEYLQGLPNKQIMTRLSISESTFHRNRREAIAILARELSGQESRLLSGKVDSF